MIKGIIFDYDGVIVDSLSGIHKIYQKMCRAVGVSCPDSLEEFRKVYGYNKHTAYKNLGIPPERADEAGLIFRSEIIHTTPSLYEGITEVLSSLSKQYQLFIMTYNTKESATKRLKSHRLLQYFQDIVGPEGEDKKFNKREAIHEQLRRHDLTAGEVIYIGDRNVDYDVAKDAGLPHLLLVEYGWGYDKEYAKGVPDYSISSPHEILAAVATITKSQK